MANIELGPEERPRVRTFNEATVRVFAAFIRTRGLQITWTETGV